MLKFWKTSYLRDVANHVLQTSKAKRRRRRAVDNINSEALETRVLLSAANGVDSGDAGQVFARIINGQQTEDFEAVGIVNDGCTGTLISPTHVLTAAHCVEFMGAAEGTFEVNGQTYNTTQMISHPSYTGDIGTDNAGDIAIMVLDRPVSGVDIVEINRTSPKVGQELTLVGFGGTGDGSGHNGDFGVKHVGTTDIDQVSSGLISWDFDNNSESNTAPGDSGGPAFLKIDGEFFVAGITSGGDQGNAGIGDHSFDTRVDAYASWIDSIVGDSSDPTPDPDPNPDPDPTPDPDPIPDPDPTPDPDPDPNPNPGGDDHVNQPGADATPLEYEDTEFAFGDGYLENGADQDVFQTTFDNNVNVDIGAFAWDGQLDLVLNVVDGDGNVVASTGTDNSTGEPLGFFDGTSLNADLPAGTYFFVVTSDSGSTGEYGVDVFVENLQDEPIDENPDPDPTPDPDPNPDPTPDPDPNPDPGDEIDPTVDDHVNEIGPDATLMEAGFGDFAYGEGTLETAGDLDVLQFVVDTDTAVTIEASSWANDLDVQFQVFDADGNLVLESSSLLVGPQFLSRTDTEEDGLGEGFDDEFGGGFDDTWGEGDFDDWTGDFGDGFDDELDGGFDDTMGEDDFGDWTGDFGEGFDDELGGGFDDTMGEDDFGDWTGDFGEGFDDELDGGFDDTMGEDDFGDWTGDFGDGVDDELDGGFDDWMDEDDFGDEAETDESGGATAEGQLSAGTYYIVISSGSDSVGHYSVDVWLGTSDDPIDDETDNPIDDGTDDPIDDGTGDDPVDEGTGDDETDGEIDGETDEFESVTEVSLDRFGRVDDYIDVVSLTGDDLEIELRTEDGTYLDSAIDGRISLAGYEAGTYLLWVNDEPSNYTVTQSSAFGEGEGDPVTEALDIDGSGDFQFASDGIVMLAFALGNRGEALEAFCGADDHRTGAEIEQYLVQMANALDVDGDGVFQFSTDGIILLAYSLGNRSEGLNAFRSPTATRTGSDMTTRLQGLSRNARNSSAQPRLTIVESIAANDSNDELHAGNSSHDDAKLVTFVEPTRLNSTVSSGTSETTDYEVVVHDVTDEADDGDVDEFFSATDELAELIASN